MTSRNFRPGFTLMESVIAIGIVAILLTTFLAVFGPATQGIRRAISVQEADRLQSTLESELQTLRTGPNSGDYDTAFEKAFEWIQKSHENDEEVFLYNYRGDPGNMRADGTMEPYTDSQGTPGRDFILQTAARRFDDNELEDDLEAISGPLYYVRMTQLVFDNGALTLGEPGQIVDPHNTGQAAADSDSFPEAVIAFSAEFYALRSNSINFVNNFDPTDADQLGQPLFSRNLAVRR